MYFFHEESGLGKASTNELHETQIRTFTACGCPAQGEQQCLENLDWLKRFPFGFASCISQHLQSFLVYGRNPAP